MGKLKDNRLAWALWNSRQKNRARRAIEDFPTALKLYYVPSEYLGKRALKGIEPTWSFVDGADPTINDGFLSLCPAYTNELPSGAEGFMVGWVYKSSGTGAAPIRESGYSDPQGGTSAYRLQLDSGVSGESSIEAPITTVSQNFSVWIKSLSGNVDVTLFLSNNVQTKQVTEEWQRLDYANTGASGNGNVRIAKRDVWGTAGYADLVVWQPQVSIYPYLYPYIPPSTSTVSQAGTSGGNGVGFKLDTELKGIFEGVADGVELGLINESIVLGAWSTKFLFNSTEGNRYKVLLTADEGSSGELRLFYDLDGDESIVVSAGESVLTTITTTTSNPVDVQAKSNGFTGTFTSSIQKLNPAQGTVATLVRMGVGSGEVPSNLSLFSVNNTAYPNVAYYDASRVVRSYDGSTAASVSTSWSRGENHLKIVQFNGTQFRVGNKRYTEDMVEIDADIVWSSWVTFDGSFDPLDYLRLSYLNTVPLHLGSLQVWNNGDVADSDIEKWGIKYYA